MATTEDYSKIFEITINDPSETKSIEELTASIKKALTEDKIPEVVLKAPPKSISILIVIVEALRTQIFDLYTIIDIYSRKEEEVNQGYMTAILLLKEPEEGTNGVLDPKSLDEMDSDCCYPQDFRYGSQSNERRKRHGQKFYHGKSEYHGRGDHRGGKFREKRNKREENDDLMFEEALAEIDSNEKKSHKNRGSFDGDRRGGFRGRGRGRGRGRDNDNEIYKDEEEDSRGHHRGGFRGRAGFRGKRNKEKEEEDNKDNNN